jgi:integrase
MSRGKRGTGDQWDVKGQDVPGGRFSRSLVMGLGNVEEPERKEEVKRRRQALNRIRAHARNADDHRDREALWALIRKIGFSGFPTWKDVVRAVTEVDFLALAHRGELHAETNARRDRDADNSERRTCTHSVDEYLRWQETEEFAEDTIATATSVLRRMLEVPDADDERYGIRRIASLVRSDGKRTLDTLAMSERAGRRVSKKTEQKNRKVLKAWFEWELQREKDRAEEYHRQPVYSINVFDAKNAGYSVPTKDASATVDDNDTRRFYPEEMTALLEAASLMWKIILVVMRCLGLRPGEFIHLRWLDEVRPLPDGNGYEVRLEGGRGRDARCKCRQCKSRKGWAPKNGPRRYVLDRRYDERGWITPAIDALDRWVRMRRPNRGDFVFPDPSNHQRSWSNNKVNRALHELGEAAGVPTGMSKRGSRTFHSLRHTCASELLEIGIDHAHAAYWIGDTLREFERTYGRPTDEAMARSIFAPVATHRELNQSKES